MSELSGKQQRAVAQETSILLAALVVEHGMSFDTAVSSVEMALHTAYWGDMDEHYQGAIVPVPTGGGNDAH